MRVPHLPATIQLVIKHGCFQVRRARFFTTNDTHRTPGQPFPVRSPSVDSGPFAGQGSVEGQQSQLGHLRTLVPASASADASRVLRRPRAAEPGKGGRLRTANGVSPPRTLAASPPLPGARGARAGQRYTTGSVSRWVENSSYLAARASHPRPLARPQPSAAPATRLHIPTLTPLRARKRLKRCTGYLLGHFPQPPMWATFKMPTRRHFAGSRNTFNYLQKYSETGAFLPHLPIPHGSGIRLAHSQLLLLVSRRYRGSAFWRSRPGGFREPVRLSPGPALEYLGCLELQFPAFTGPLAGGYIQSPPPPSGSRLLRFLLHLVRARFTACLRLLSHTCMRDKL